jgi:hypothetical protein
VCDCLFRNHLPVYTNPFAKRDEVRGYEQAGAIALRATDGIHHGANGALTVCAGDMDDLPRSGGFPAAVGDLPPSLGYGEPKEIAAP